ncbi:hypothetical protein ACN47E_007809 [Coniothyrium glycines]
MGKKKADGVYNDYLDGEKLRDNAEIRTSLQDMTSVTRSISPPSINPSQPRTQETGIAKNNAKKPPLTHFLCLPLVTNSNRPTLQHNLSTLHDDLSSSQLVPPNAIRPPGTIHLTLGVMSLSPSTLHQATLFLRNLDIHRLLRDVTHQRLAEKAAEDGAISENLIAASMPDTDSLSITLEGLLPMQSPRSTSILYAEPKDASRRLFPFAQAVRDKFLTEGLLVQDDRPLKLHATIINTIYAKPGARRRGRKSENTSKAPRSPVPGIENEAVHDNTTQSLEAENADRTQGHGPEAKSWLRFDAGTLIERYRGFAWAEDIQVDRVQICKMGAKKVWSGGVEGKGEVLDERYEVVCERGIFE